MLGNLFGDLLDPERRLPLPLTLCPRRSQHHAGNVIRARRRIALNGMLSETALRRLANGKDQTSLAHKQNKRLWGSARLNKNSIFSIPSAIGRDSGARNGASPLNVPMRRTVQPACSHTATSRRLVKCVTCCASSIVATNPALSSSHSINGQALR